MNYIGKLEFRVDGDFWRVHYRLADDEKIELGSIRLPLVDEDEKFQASFKELMKVAMTKLIKEAGGEVPLWTQEKVVE